MGRNKDFRAKRKQEEFNLLTSVYERTVKLGRYSRYLESSSSWRSAATNALMIKALTPNLEYSLRVASIFANHGMEGYSSRDVASAYLRYLGRSSLNLSGYMRVYEDKLDDIMPGVPVVIDDLREQPFGGVVLTEPHLEISKTPRVIRKLRTERYGIKCDSKIDLIGHMTLNIYNAVAEVQFKGFDLGFMNVGSNNINRYIVNMTEQYGVARARDILADVALLESIYVPCEPYDPVYGEIDFGVLKS